MIMNQISVRSGGAIKPAIKTFKEVKGELEKLPKDKPILTYCTGDIRCEYLSAYMKHKGFRDVYHLDGGIVKYGELYGDEGLWEGKCYVFDRRMRVAFSDTAKDVGICVRCGGTTSNHENCARVACNRLILLCEDCTGQTGVCSKACATALDAPVLDAKNTGTLGGTGLTGLMPDK